MGHTLISKDGDKSNERPTHPPVSASAVFWSGVCQHNTETLGLADKTEGVMHRVCMHIDGHQRGKLRKTG